MKSKTSLLLMLFLLLTLLLPLPLVTEAETEPIEKSRVALSVTLPPVAEAETASERIEKEEPEPIDSALIQSAYPEMPPYPDEDEFVDEKTGNVNQDALKRVYDAWWKEKRERREQREQFYGDFGEFIARTSQEILLKSREKNPLYSPLSLYMALSMLCEVTGGKSREEVLELLGAKDLEEVQKNALSIWNSNYSDDGAVSSRLANSFWLNEGFSYQKETLNQLAKHYFAASFQGEMGSEAYNEDLRRWINQETGGLLKEQAGQLCFTRDMVFSLVSTIFFQAKWQEEFNQDKNEERIFHGREQDQTCSFMQSENPETYYWAENFGAICKGLHYGGVVWLILPDKNSSVEEVLKNPKFYELISKDHPGEDWKDSKFLIVHLLLPKFDVAANLRLEENLKALGVQMVFEQDKADFSPLFQYSEVPAFLSDVQQGSRVAIDEQGVTATAFTAMRMDGAAKPPEEKIDFVLDRPFVFVICGISGDPLFIGGVNQPSTCKETR